MNLLTNRLYLSAVGVLMVFVIGVAYLFAAVLDEPLTSRPDAVTVELTSTGGLFEGSAVTYRGVKVGKVTAIVSTSEGAEATVTLADDAEVPADTTARVRSLSPVGEQYLDFQPTTTEGPYLADGDRVDADSTEVPVSLSSTVLAVGKVLDQIDATKLRRLLVALSEGLGGTGDDLGQLLDQGSLLLADLDAAWPQTERLLRNSGPVLDIPVSQSDDLRELAGSAKELAAFLRDYDPELRATLRRTPAQLRQLRSLVRDIADTLPAFLRTGLGFTDEFVRHDPHLRTLLQEYAPGLGTFTRVIKNGELRLELIPDKDARCRYDIARRDDRDPNRRQLQANGHCPASFDRLQRGAAHAPGPIALPKF